MSDQRIDTGAAAATSTDADPAEGQGTARPDAGADPLGPRLSGGDADLPQPPADRAGTGAGAGQAADTADTEGARGLQEAHRRAEAQQAAEPDLGGREPAGDDAARPSLAPGSAGSGPARAETGEVSAVPSAARRAEDPGSVATEFGDRAASAPEDEIAHPQI